MKIIFEIKRKDLWKQRRWAKWNMPTYRNTNILFYLIWLALFSQEISERVNIFAAILYVLLLTFSYIVFQFVLDVVCFISDIYLIKRQGIVCEHIIEITADGLREQTDANETFRRWKYIDLIKDNESCIYYCVGNQYLGIPKRAFGTKLEAEQFFQQALSFWQESRRK